MTHDGLHYPCAPGCLTCRAARRCNHCGADLRHDAGRCTNGRCTTCHATVCGAGGDTAPGHAFFRRRAER